jgi:hydroxyacylglutathione hydrolase
MEQLIDIQLVKDEVARGEAAIMDVRTQEEWDAGHIAGAMHYCLDRIAEGEIPALPRDMKIYTHCRSGGRATQAAEKLANAGFSKVVCLGGYLDWKEAGGPVVE